MAVVDIVLIAVLLLFAIIGTVRGFFKALFSIIGTAGSVAIAIVCAKPVSAFLNSLFDMVGFFSKTVAGAITGVLPVFETTTATTDLATIPSYLKIFMNSATTEYANTEALCAEISTTIGGFISIAISVIIIFILVRLALALLSKLFSFATKAGLGRGLDKILGFAFGLAKGALLISVLFGIVFLLKGVPFVANTVIDTVISKSVVANWGYINISQLISGWIGSIDFNALIQSIFGIA